MQSLISRRWLLSSLVGGTLVGSFLLTRATGAEPKAATGGKEVRLLAVGNSFSGNATRHLGKLVDASGGGNRLIFGHAMIPGCPLEKHVVLAEVFEKDPNDPKGRPYAKQASLRDMLEREKWDYVTIQQASIKSFDIATYRPWAKKLHDYIKRYAPQAEVLVHQTWAYRDDDPLFRDGSFTPEMMHTQLTQAYRTIADELGCRIIPVGDAFYAVRQLPSWQFDVNRKIDPKQYKYPQAPEQGKSLHVGWKWLEKNGKRTLPLDAHHANLAGEYLGGCVWFELLYGQSVVGNSHVPRGLSAEDAITLQKAAHQVVGAAAAKRP